MKMFSAMRGVCPECGARLAYQSPEAVNLSRERRDQCWSGAPSASPGVKKGELPMKKVLFALVATLVAVSVSGCAGLGKGKGKAPPPPPIVRKG